MQDSINRFNQAVDTNRDRIQSLTANKILSDDLDPIILSHRQQIIQLIQWLKRLGNDRQQRIAFLLNQTELDNMIDNLTPTVDLLTQAETDQTTSNRAGRIFSDPNGFSNDLLNYRSAFVVLERITTASRISQQDARSAADQAQEALIEVQSLVQQEAIRTLAEYFQELVTESPKLLSERRSTKWAWVRWFYRGHGYQERAQRWFNITVIAVLMTIGYTILFTYDRFPLNSSDSPALLYAKIGIHALALVPLVYLIRVCVKNYDAFMHLAALNRHKVKSLQTLKSYLEDGRISDVARQEILIEAAKHVFDPGETGFISKKEGAGGEGTAITVSPKIGP